MHKLFPKVRFVGILSSLIWITGCAPELPNDPKSQIKYACEFITNWPTDYRTVWPTAIEKHNASPETVSASDYMRGYINSLAIAFNINDTEAQRLVNDYKEYWSFLEFDLILNKGVLPEKAVSTSKLSDLMKYCDSLGYGFTLE